MKKLTQFVNNRHHNAMIPGTAMCLFYLVCFFVAVQAAPVHQLEGEALELAKRNGFLSDNYDRLHVVQLSEHIDNALHPLDVSRIRKRRETRGTTKVNVPIKGANFTLSLSHPDSVLHEDVEITLVNKTYEEQFHYPTSDCHLVGGIDGHKGSASFSYCDEVRGFMVVQDIEYIVLPLEDGRHLVSEQKKPGGWPYNEFGSIIEAERELFNESESSFDDYPFMETHSSFVASSGDEDEPKVVIELAVYSDEDMTKLLDNAKADTVQKKVDYIISKFNGVQYEYAKIEQLKRVVVFKIKKMVFYKTNPSWLKVTGRLGPMLGSLCNWNRDKKPYDIVYMITGHNPMYPIGLAWVGGSCNRRTRCGVSIGTAWGRYVAIAHEIGHLLGMKHDYDTECKKLPQKELGLMGGKGTDFSKCSVEGFLKHIEKPEKKCLFETNIPDRDVMAELKDVQLEFVPSVVNVTHHKYCEELMGPGYRYREKEGMKYSCDRGYYCVQLNEGPDFGLIYRERAQGIVGMYCAPGKVCLKKQCLTYKLMTLHTPWVVRAGGWGKWSEWTPCSRSCGTGVKYSHRECDNPVPIQDKYCDGNEYRAELCNTDPCPDDPINTDSLIKCRADETCKRLVEANALNPEFKYKETGRVIGESGGVVYPLWVIHLMSYPAVVVALGCIICCVYNRCFVIRHNTNTSYIYESYDDVCDTHCDNEKDADSRDAILPDGTPCWSPDPEFDVGTSDNVKMHCFRGKCQVFGCDGSFPAKYYGSDPECKDDGSEIIG